MYARSSLSDAQRVAAIALLEAEWRWDAAANHLAGPVPYAASSMTSFILISNSTGVSFPSGNVRSTV